MAWAPGLLVDLVKLFACGGGSMPTCEMRNRQWGCGVGEIRRRVGGDMRGLGCFRENYFGDLCGECSLRRERAMTAREERWWHVREANSSASASAGVGTDSEKGNGDEGCGLQEEEAKAAGFVEGWVALIF